MMMNRCDSSQRIHYASTGAIEGVDSLEAEPFGCIRLLTAGQEGGNLVDVAPPPPPQGSSSLLVETIPAAPAIPAGGSNPPAKL
jgi:hypothetical protein